jgi:hypothetical protein
MAISNVDIKKSCEELVEDIFSKGKTIHGNKLSSKIKDMVVVEGNKNSARVLVPYWFSVTQYGRGKRKTNNTEWTDTGLVNRKGEAVLISTFQLALYEWMKKYNRFQSRTPLGKVNDAKSLAYYINANGNYHHRQKVYIDIYDTLTIKLVEDLTKEVGRIALRITSELIKL